ncbi:MAG: hypothetical protein NT003_01795 [Candidatus Magasanikbacteria bacterium]|nr:hypothetical protein [Candidatus Magasanikbacteria bacterium]
MTSLQPKDLASRDRVQFSLRNWYLSAGLGPVGHVTLFDDFDVRRAAWPDVSELVRLENSHAFAFPVREPVAVIEEFPDGNFFGAYTFVRGNDEDAVNDYLASLTRLPNQGPQRLHINDIGGLCIALHTELTRYCARPQFGKIGAISQRLIEVVPGPYVFAMMR